MVAHSSLQGRREGDSTESISLALYPDPDKQEGLKGWINNEMDVKVDAVMKVTDGFLKIRGSYFSGQYSKKTPEAYVFAKEGDIMTCFQQMAREKSF